MIENIVYSDKHEKTSDQSIAPTSDEIFLYSEYNAMNAKINELATWFNSATTQTVTANSIAVEVSKAINVVGTSDLETLIFPNSLKGEVLLIFTQSLTIKHGEGNIYLTKGADFLVSEGEVIPFYFNGTNCKEIGRATAGTSHDQNTDLKLDEGGMNEVSSVQLKRLINQYSCGIIDTDAPTITDNGNGTATFAACNVAIRDNANHTGEILTSAVPQATLTFVDGQKTYVTIDYNSGTPIYAKKTTWASVTGSDIILVYICQREGTTIHNLNQDSCGLGLPNKIEERITGSDLYKIDNDGGLMLSETTSPTNRTILCTGANVYAGVALVNVLAFNSSTDILTELVHTVSGWTSSNVATYDNTNYNAESSGKTPANNNKWLYRLYYRSIGDVKQMYYVLSPAEYNSAEEARVASLSGRLTTYQLLTWHVMPVGRSIIQKSIASGTTEAFKQSSGYYVSGIVNHNDTNNIQGGQELEYYHITALEHQKLQDLQAANLLVTGFQYSGAANTDSTLAFVNGTRTFSITTATNYNFWLKGVKFNKTTTQSVVIANTAGVHFIYFDATGTIQTSLTAWDLLGDFVPIATITWNGSEGLIGEERHGVAMNKPSHKIFHNGVGPLYISGLSQTTSGSGNTFSIASGVYCDEDIFHALTTLTQGRLFYRNNAGANITWDAAGTAFIKKNGTAIQYDNSGVLTDATNNNSWVAYWFFATNIIDYPIGILVGQRQDTSEANADLNNTYNSLVFPTGFNIEWKPIWRILVRNNTPTFTVSTLNADIRVINARTGGVTSGSSDHTLLTNRDAANQHPATAIALDVTNFNGILSGANTTGQSAFDTIDNINSSGIVWTNILSAANPTPSTTTTITMTSDLTATVKRGMGAKFKVGAETTYRYGIITAITASLLTIAKSTGGLTTGSNDLKELYWCSSHNLRSFYTDLNYKTLNAVNTTNTGVLVDSANHGNYLPNKFKTQKGRIIVFEIIALSKGTGSNPVVNFKITTDGSTGGYVCSSNLTINSNNTWIDSGITVNPANNIIDNDSVLSMQVITAGTVATEATFQTTIILE